MGKIHEYIKGQATVFVLFANKTHYKEGSCSQIPLIDVIAKSKVTRSQLTSNQCESVKRAINLALEHLPTQTCLSPSTSPYIYGEAKSSIHTKADTRRIGNHFGKKTTKNPPVQTLQQGHNLRH